MSGNTAGFSGGGIYVVKNTVRLFNATITDNQADANLDGVGAGGGVYVEVGATLSFQNSIIARNVDSHKFGMFWLPSDGDCKGTVNSAGNNIIYNYDTLRCTVVGTVILADPKLGPLQGNAGPSPTHALLSGSPAIDAANATGCRDNFGAVLITDQRGVTRPSGGGCDIGAYESSPVLDVDASRPATKYDPPTDALLVLRYMFGVTGPLLTSGALGGTSTRTDPAAIKAYLDGMRLALDIDGDGTVDALTDGLLIMRYILGLRGQALIVNAVAPYAARKTAPEIEQVILALMP